MSQTAAASKSVKFIITRQDNPETNSYTEEFEIPYRPGMNVISALMEIQRNPKMRRAKPPPPYAGTPTAWKKCAELAPWSSTGSRAKHARP